jgi:fumarate hydratase subunit alpha
MAVVFVTIGQDVRIIGGSLADAINEGVRKGYEEGFLRKSVVADPIRRVNTKDNTPAVIHYEITPGDGFSIMVSPKGFGSENMSRLAMLIPSDGLEGIKNFVLDTVKKADSNTCPPIVVGVGIGGTFELSAIMAKKALLRPLGEPNPDPFWAAIETELLDKINKTGIGPAGFGGQNTAMAVHINTFATHIAGMPVAVNLGCHVNRHEEAKL